MNDSKNTKPRVATPATFTPLTVLERQRQRANRTLLKRRQKKSGQ